MNREKKINLSPSPCQKFNSHTKLRKQESSNKSLSINLERKPAPENMIKDMLFFFFKPDKSKEEMLC